APPVYYTPPVYYAPPPPPVYYAPPPVVYSPPPAYAAPGYSQPGYSQPGYSQSGYAPLLPPDAVPVSGYYQGPGGQTCRQYSTSIYVYGRPQTSSGTACLQGDGTWRMVNY